VEIRAKIYPHSIHFQDPRRFYFIIYTYLTRVATSSTVTDDFTNLVMPMMLNTVLYKACSKCVCYQI